MRYLSIPSIRIILTTTRQDIPIWIGRCNLIRYYSNGTIRVDIKNAYIRVSRFIATNQHMRSYTNNSGYKQVFFGLQIVIQYLFIQQCNKRIQITSLLYNDLEVYYYSIDNTIKKILTHTDTNVYTNKGILRDMVYEVVSRSIVKGIRQELYYDIYIYIYVKLWYTDGLQRILVYIRG